MSTVFSCALLLPLADPLLDAVELSSIEPFEHCARFHFSELRVDTKEERDDLAAAICADGCQAQPPTCF